MRGGIINLEFINEDNMMLNVVPKLLSQRYPVGVIIAYEVSTQ